MLGQQAITSRASFNCDRASPERAFSTFSSSSSTTLASADGGKLADSLMVTARNFVVVKIDCSYAADVLESDFLNVNRDALFVESVHFAPYGYRVVGLVPPVL
jgi:hypothetical protein